MSKLVYCALDERCAIVQLVTRNWIFILRCTNKQYGMARGLSADWAAFHLLHLPLCNVNPCFFSVLPSPSPPSFSYNMNNAGRITDPQLTAAHPCFLLQRCYWDLLPHSSQCVGNSSQITSQESLLPVHVGELESFSNHIKSAAVLKIQKNPRSKVQA